ncbi:hypothetical protein [Desulfonauticus submarinus]
MKKFFLLKKEYSIKQRPAKDFDLVEMPLEGVVVYWLSLAKIFSRRNVLEDELNLTTEPYIKFLLKLLKSKLDANQCLELAKVKRNNFLEDLEKKLTLMSISILGMATRENPQKVLIRFISKYPLSLIYEQKIIQAAKEVVANIHLSNFKKEGFLNIDHRMDPEKLMINLMVYNFLERRVEHDKLRDCLEYVRSLYFAEGLSLIVDGFEYDFVKYRLNLQKKEIIFHTRNKMKVSAELCVGLKKGFSYDDLSLIAQAYL